MCLQQRVPEVCETCVANFLFFTESSRQMIYVKAEAHMSEHAAKLILHILAVVGIKSHISISRNTMLCVPALFTEKTRVIFLCKAS